MRKVFLMLTVSLFSLNAEAQECVDAPSCTDLGYTQTEADCPNGAVKCPWNSGLVFCGCNENYQYSCTGTNETAGDSKCGDYYASCNCDSGYKWENGKCVSVCSIGDIYYTDNTCLPADKHDSSKTALGVVIYIKDEGLHGQIMAPKPISADGSASVVSQLQWSKRDSDLSILPNVDKNQVGENIWSSSESGPYSYNPWVLSVSTNNVTLGNTYRKTERLTVRPVMEFQKGEGR